MWGGMSEEEREALSPPDDGPVIAAPTAAQAGAGTMEATL